MDPILELLHEASPASYEKMMTLYTTCGDQSVGFCQEAIAAKIVSSAKQTGGASVDANSHDRAQ